MNQKGRGLDASLFLGPLLRTLMIKNEFDNNIKHQGEYDKNLLPNNPEQFLLTELVNGAIQILKNLNTPSLVYLHFYPPHHPYTPTKKFANAFNKSKETIIEKPYHQLVESKKTFSSTLLKNQQYDRFLASWDSELERLYQFIEKSGLREKSYIMITSDHGELFERGEADHMTPLLNQPVVRVPLIISYPGVSERKDIHSTTSSVDILPTIAQLSGKTKPDWVDGQILPGFGGTEDSERSVYCFEAKENSSFGPFIKYSIALSKNNKRLLYYNYDNYKEFEFYDLDTDPEEMNNLYPAQSADVKIMEQELLQKIDEISVSIKK